MAGQVKRSRRQLCTKWDERGPRVNCTSRRLSDKRSVGRPPETRHAAVAAQRKVCTERQSKLADAEQQWQSGAAEAERQW